MRPVSAVVLALAGLLKPTAGAAFRDMLSLHIYQGCSVVPLPFRMPADPSLVSRHSTCLPEYRV